jgi:peptidoglycan-associated lipoprotein
MEKIFSTLIIAGLIVSGCSNRGIVKETEQLQSQNQISAAQKQADETPADRKTSEETVTSRELAPTPHADSMGLLKELQAQMRDIHFDFDLYTIRSDEKIIVNKIAAILRKNNSLKVTIEGNCDERGTEEYNLALSDRRASAAKKYLLSLGVEAERMDTVSYGKDKPLCTEHNEACWRENRRDHFALSEGKP